MLSGSGSVEEGAGLSHVDLPTRSISGCPQQWGSLGNWRCGVGQADAELAGREVVSNACGRNNEKLPQGCPLLKIPVEFLPFEVLKCSPRLPF